MQKVKFQPGDLVKFSPYNPPTSEIMSMGVVVESRRITHAERGYVYEATTVQLGDRQYTLPASDFKLIQRVLK